MLAAYHGTPPRPPSSDPFELVLFENVAYLARDDRRLQAFAHLKSTIGTEPAALLGATTEALEAVTSWGILKGTSAAKLRRCAAIAIDEFQGDLSGLVQEPTSRAMRVLQRFPGIGEPGAEKILLFAAGRPFLAPDSNALRVMVRLGLVQEEPSYARTYAGARSVAAALGSDPALLQRAHGLLRVHGQTLCRRQPDCHSCPLRAVCPYTGMEQRRA
jgi:endonuclease-3